MEPVTGILVSVKAINRFFIFWFYTDYIDQYSHSFCTHFFTEMHHRRLQVDSNSFISILFTISILYTVNYIFCVQKRHLILILAFCIVKGITCRSRNKKKGNEKEEGERDEIGTSSVREMLWIVLRKPVPVGRFPNLYPNSQRNLDQFWLI